MPHPLRAPPPDDDTVSTVDRVFSAVLGVMCVVLAGMMVWARLADESPWLWLVIAACGVLGVDGVWSAFTVRRSLLSRLGPLP